MAELTSTLIFWRSPAWLLPDRRSAAGHELMLDHLIGLSPVDSKPPAELSPVKRGSALKIL